MFVKRLRRMVDLLKTVKDEQFNMRHWECGTTSCAMGHAARFPEFQAAGLTMQKFVWSTAGCPTYKNCYGFGAATKFFGISWEQAEWLFDPCEYRSQGATTAKQVATRIKRFIDKYEASRRQQLAV